MSERNKMTTLHFASFRETQYHGNGRKLAITTSKPDELKVDGAFKPFIPPQEMSDKYRELQLENQAKASDYFVSSFKRQLSDFFEQVREDAKKEGKTVMEMLPFRDGDTFLTWERFGYTSYRPLVAEFLQAEGYTVELK
jgi:hypothetical protein